MTHPLALADIDTLSREIADAAGELACRIDMGEFDDLDEAQMLDLRALSDTMGHWAALAQTLEERLGQARHAPAPPAMIPAALQN
jgi:hypothetical protein